MTTSTSQDVKEAIVSIVDETGTELGGGAFTGVSQCADGDASTMQGDGE